MKKYNWIVSDLDGTIIYHNEGKNLIYPEVINSINEFINDGGKFTIATGRHYSDVISIIEKNKINYKDDFFIAGMNGCQIYSWGQKKLINNIVLNRENILEVKDIVQELFNRFNDKIIVFAYGENKNVFTLKLDNDKFEALYTEIIEYEDNEKVFNYSILDKEELFNKNNLIKFCIGFEDEIQDPDKLVNELSKLSSNITFIQTGVKFVEMMPNGMNKGIAIKWINDNFYKMDKENILALGDSGNDIEMFKYAGKSITRTCAAQYIKDSATEVSEDGPSIFVKTAINKYWFGE